MNEVRPSPIAGRWYEGDPRKLAAAVDSWLDAAPAPDLPGPVTGVIAPHAGHIYSGQVAAHAFATLAGLEPDLVVVLSPHHEYTPATFLTSAHRFFATPLGKIEVDLEALKDLAGRLDLPLQAVANDREHSLEIELPFLQRALKRDFKLLPLMVRAENAEQAVMLGTALARTLKDRRALLVASTDLSHFYDAQTAGRLDHEMLKRFEAMDPQAIFEAEATGRGFACGHGAVAAMLWAAKKLGADRVKTLAYATSGDVTGDLSSVVGYGAAVVYKGE